MLAISQSGRSPDLLASAGQARTSGALLAAMVNDEELPLAEMADVLIPLAAGPERSVAATKSFIAALAAILDLLAAWTEDESLDAALTALPGKLTASWELDWTAAIPRSSKAEAIYLAARGHGLGIAQEAALKLKETCGMHAEAFSAAEIRHGPMAVVKSGLPGIPVRPGGRERRKRDRSGEGICIPRRLRHEYRSARGPWTDAADDRSRSADRSHPSDRKLLPVGECACFARGRDPDRPPHLSKVTETL